MKRYIKNKSGCYNVIFLINIFIVVFSKQVSNSFFTIISLFNMENIEEHSLLPESTTSNLNLEEILKKPDDLYYTEYLLRKYFSEQPNGFNINSDELILLSNYVDKYNNFNHLFDSDLEYFILEKLKTAKTEKSADLLKCVACLSFAYEDENVEYFRKMLGYSKIYNCIKESIKDIKFKMNSYKYLGYLILLLNNDSLVYKNLKPLLSNLIRYVKNDLVEKSIAGCANIASSVITGAPTLFTDKLAMSLISYFLKVIYSPKNYIFLNYDEICEILTCLKLLLTVYNNLKDSGSKKFATGLLREITGKMEELRSSSVYEDISVLTNLCNLLPYVFEFYTSFKDKNIDFIKDTKKYLYPAFIYGVDYNNESKTVDELKENRKIKKSLDFNEIIKDNEKIKVKPIKMADQRETKIFIDLFLKYKYSYLDCLIKYHNVFDRITLMNDLVTITHPSEMLRNFDNINEYIDWNDLIPLAYESDSIEYLKYLFNDYFLKYKEHDQFIDIFRSTLTVNEYQIYFAKFCCMKNKFSVVFDIYISDLNLDDDRTNKMREIILTALNEEDLTDLNYFKDKKMKLQTKNEYQNLLMLIIVLISKINPISYKDSGDKYEAPEEPLITKNREIIVAFISKYLNPKNEFNDFYIACMLYLDKSINREFNSYFSVILEIMSIRLRQISDLTDFKERTFPLLFQMTYKEVQELGILMEYNDHIYKDSRFYKKYLDLLELLKDTKNNEEDINNKNEKEDITNKKEDINNKEEDINNKNEKEDINNKNEKEDITNEKEDITNEKEDINNKNEKEDITNKEEDINNDEDTINKDEDIINKEEDITNKNNQFDISTDSLNKNDNSSLFNTNDVLNTISADETISTNFSDEKTEQGSIMNEKEFLEKQHKLIDEKYELAKKEKEVGDDKYKLAKKEHDLIESNYLKAIREQKKIKNSYKKALEAQNALDQQFEELKKEKEMLKKKFGDAQQQNEIITGNFEEAKKNNHEILEKFERFRKNREIIEQNLKKAQEAHKKSDEKYTEAKKKYEEQLTEYKEAVRDLSSENSVDKTEKQPVNVDEK
ncbi:hypothetical protein NUSPORA_01889 [Nucleospora cyclopteri]